MQTPFSTINFGLGTSYESRCIQKAILQNRIKGLGKDGITPAFPKLIFTLKHGTNMDPTDPNYDIKQLALKCSAKRMYPDILSYEKIIEVTGDFKASMGCRSHLSSFTDAEGRYITDGRNNMGVVSLNLPRIAIESSSPEHFYELLDKKLELCKQALMFRIKSLSQVQAKVAPILYQEGAIGVRLKPEDYVIDVFKNGRATISLGYVGIHETMCHLFKVESWVGNSYYEWFAKNIVKYMYMKTDEWKAETGYGFSVYATPAENLVYRFCKLDKSEYGLIPNVTDHKYYTNSFHLNVREVKSVYDKIDFESEYPEYSKGGFISFVELPSLINNLEALESIWDYAMSKLPYFAVNSPTDKCYVCNYEGEITADDHSFTCPQCGNKDYVKMDITRRTCGYLGKAERPFNIGKQQEVSQRVKHL